MALGLAYSLALEFQRRWQGQDLSKNESFRIRKDWNDLKSESFEKLGKFFDNII